MIYSLSMAKSMLEGKNLNPSATGPAGPLPRRAYCQKRCFEKGKHELSRPCRCTGCGGDAHGCGRRYALDHGYLKESPIGSRRPPEGHPRLFPTSPPLGRSRLVESSSHTALMLPSTQTVTTLKNQLYYGDKPRSPPALRQGRDRRSRLLDPPFNSVRITTSSSREGRLAVQFPDSRL